MEVNGHKLPDAFIEGVNKNRFFREIGSWPLKRDVDSYGNHLETELGKVFDSIEEITEETNKLDKDFTPDGVYGAEFDWKNEPGFIDDITDFANIVSFAIDGGGSPFCFDFRNSEEAPKIIWWDDCYWRVISPCIEEFLNLFEINS